MPVPRIIVVALLVLAAWPSPMASAETEQERVRRIVLELVAREEPPPTLADWKRAGRQANRILVELVDDRSLRPSLRLRAIACLAWFPSKRSEAVLTGLLAGRKTDLSVRRAAMLALTLAFGERTIEDVRPFLQSSETLLREGAIRAIGAVPSERARAILARHAEIERDIYLRGLAEQLASGAPPPPPAPRPR